MELWDRIAEIADRWDVLRHPFYVRWSSGDLTGAELALYAGQYAHAVRGLAVASRHAARLASPDLAGQLADHAEEEESHVSLWTQFAETVGGDADAAPLPETEECAAAWGDERRGFLDTLVALYAIESAQPAISETKRAGLTRHYGIVAGPATAYFDVHAVRDHEHAQSARRCVASRLRGGDPDPLVASADRVLAANWRLLDGVVRAAATSALPG